MNTQPNLQWARNIVSEWDRGDYPKKYESAYRLACKALGVEPKPHPESIMKEKYRADVHG